MAGKLIRKREREIKAYKYYLITNHLKPKKASLISPYQKALVEKKLLKSKLNLEQTPTNNTIIINKGLHSFKFLDDCERIASSKHIAVVATIEIPVDSVVYEGYLFGVSGFLENYVSDRVEIKELKLQKHSILGYTLKERLLIIKSLREIKEKLGID